jgi:RNase P subunit RPR2
MSLKDVHWCDKCEWPLRFHKLTKQNKKVKEVWNCNFCGEIYVYDFKKKEDDEE